VKTFESIFTTENAELTAQAILESLDDKETQVDYDFYFQKGKFISNDINTWIRFDTNQYPLLSEMLDILTNDEIKVTKERISLFSDFRDKVCAFLVEDFKKQVSDKLRDCVFGGTINEQMCPIKQIKAVNFDIADVPDSTKYLLVVRKEQPKDEISEGVSKDLYEYLHDIEAVMSKEEIEEKLNEFIIERKGCDSKFKYIEKVTLKRAFFECQVELFVDYTMIKPEEISSSGGIENIPEF